MSMNFMSKEREKTDTSRSIIRILFLPVLIAVINTAAILLRLSSKPLLGDLHNSNPTLAPSNTDTGSHYCSITSKICPAHGFRNRWMPCAGEGQINRGGKGKCVQKERCEVQYNQGKRQRQTRGGCETSQSKNAVGAVSIFLGSCQGVKQTRPPPRAPHTAASRFPKTPLPPHKHCAPRPSRSRSRMHAVTNTRILTCQSLAVYWRLRVTEPVA